MDSFPEAFFALIIFIISGKSSVRLMKQAIER